MNDLISRQKTIDAMRELPYGYRGIVWDILNSLPSAQPEQKRGKWVTIKYPFSKCSICNCDFDAANNEANYCPVCGAKMDMEGE